MNSDSFGRIRQMIGEGGLARLRGASVAVVGLGAVGSYAVEGLARAGVGRLRLVDFDSVQPSNINRQLYALHSTVGRAKCELAAERARDINPAVAVEPLSIFAHADTVDEVLAPPLDLVIDAIDSLGPKTELLAAAVARGLPLLASMGAALRTDPTRVRIGPLSEARGCPLARLVRKRLRKRGVDLEIPCVYSSEPAGAWTQRAVVAPEDRQDDADETIRGRRRSSLGSLPTLTGIFGLTLANEALRMLLGGFDAHHSEREGDAHGRDDA